MFLIQREDLVSPTPYISLIEDIPEPLLEEDEEKAIEEI